MRPKVEAALYHLANEGRRVIITDIESLPKALQGKAGRTSTLSRRLKPGGVP